MESYSSDVWWIVGLFSLHFAHLKASEFLFFEALSTFVTALSSS